MAAVAHLSLFPCNLIVNCLLEHLFFHYLYIFLFIWGSPISVLWFYAQGLFKDHIYQLAIIMNLYNESSALKIHHSSPQLVFHLLPHLPPVGAHPRVFISLVISCCSVLTFTMLRVEMITRLAAQISSFPAVCTNRAGFLIARQDPARVSAAGSVHMCYLSDFRLILGRGVSLEKSSPCTAKKKRKSSNSAVRVDLNTKKHCISEDCAFIFVAAVYFYNHV